MSTDTLHLEGMQRHWRIAPALYGNQSDWIIWAVTPLNRNNPAAEADGSRHATLTEAYDAWVAADFADNGESYD